MSVDSDRKLLNDLGIELGDVIKLDPNRNGYFVTSYAMSGKLYFMNFDSRYTIEDFIEYFQPKKENIIFLKRHYYEDKEELELAYSQVKKYER